MLDLLLRALLIEMLAICLADLTVVAQLLLHASQYCGAVEGRGLIFEKASAEYGPLRIVARMMGEPEPLLQCACQRGFGTSRRRSSNKCIAHWLAQVSVQSHHTSMYG